MKKILERTFAFLLCMCLIFPQHIVEAVELNENASISGEQSENGIDNVTGDNVIGDGSGSNGTVENDETGYDDENEAVEGDGTADSANEDEADNGDDQDDIEDAEPLDVGDEPTSLAHGSGSYQLNEVATDYRFYTEYFVKADTKKSISSAGVDRRTAIKVYAQAGETIYFGSSVSNSQIDENNQYTGSVTGKDIVITKPDGSKVCEDVLPDGAGYIKNYKQEKNGPMIISADMTHPDDYYEPLQYPVTTTGVYLFEFHSVTGFNPNSAGKNDLPKPKKAGEEWSQGNTTVAAWDITVVDGAMNIKSGRAWADYLALTTAEGNQTKSDLDVHVLSHDGYLYKVNFKETVPFGFIFFANNTGFMSVDTDESDNTFYHPVYHSFYDSNNDLNNIADENIFLHKPNVADTDSQETYKIFFNAPSDDLNGVTYDKNGKAETIKTAPDTKVELSDLKFVGVGGNENVALSGHGGYFTFHSNGEAMVTIRLDLRKAILESEGTMDSYEGSGIVEITTPAVANGVGEVNSVYWNGKDTDGITLPAGIYGNNNVALSTEVKRGELHFPVIDMEGLLGGLTVQRINGENTGTDDCYNLYYNNNPLAYGTIEGSNYSIVRDGNFNKLSDGTKSYRVSSTTGGITYFKYGQESISTLVKDDKEYLAEKMFNTSYASLTPDKKSIIDAEYGKELDTFHFVPVNSSKTSMKFSCSGYNGGGNQAGIDAWTYYTQGIDSDVISFALIDNDARGLVSGQIFYDSNISSSYDAGDYWLSGVKVRLIDSHGKPLVHKESLPLFDKTGHFMYDENGNVIHKDTDVEYVTETDSTGTYRFTGVPYSLTENTTYYVQVLLSDVQSEVMRYTCTTSNFVKNHLIYKGNPFITAGTIAGDCGPDGNAISPTDDETKIYGYKYERDDENEETVFDINHLAENAQSVTFVAPYVGSDIIREEKFNKIGYSSTVPDVNQKDYKIKKEWGTDTNPISDGLIVELWVWNDDEVQEENSHQISRRTGALLDTQVLHADTNPDNNWTYIWTNLDDRLQYYVLEYYTKKKPNGELIYDDKGVPRKVLIGGTMPIFSYVPKAYRETGIYGFSVNLGDYPETFEYSEGNFKIPIQKFSENDDPSDGKTHPITHANSLTTDEKLESVDNNARQYNVTYTLTKEDSGKTNVITLNNSQLFDDKAYYVWLDHETELPELISKTYLDGGLKKSHAVDLIKDTNHVLEDGSYCIKGLSISSIDAAQTTNIEGNATNAFRIKEDGKQYALFTATDHGNYKTGIGTRTYKVKYVVDSATKNPVSVTTDNGALVLTENPSVKVEGSSAYTVYSWFMTIHVYDVKSDGVLAYNPEDGPIVLQEALAKGAKLKWTLTHDGFNYNSINYTSDDERTAGIFSNDTYRLPLYKGASNPDMGSCADIVGIAYAGSKPVDDVSKLKFEDTYESRYGHGDVAKPEDDGIAVAQGNNGSVEVDLNTPRGTRIDRVQDHANYAKVTFTPDRLDAYGEDVFYYKLVVFAEDNTYQYHNYEDIDASEGVVMYTYFTMKSNKEMPIINGGTPRIEDLRYTILMSDDVNAAGLKLGSKTPKTGDKNNPGLWFGIIVLAMAIIGFGLSKKKQAPK